MADVKITSLAVLTAADPINDAIPIVDVSDVTMAASGTTKRISVNNILSSSPTATGAFSVTGLVTAGSAAVTGAATVGTTLGVTGASTLASVGVTGAATVGTTLLVGTNATLTNGNVIIGTAGKGIDFTASTDGTGTVTAELLNDYEEGTWTPTITFATLSVGVTYSTQTGIYTKVGRIVHFSGRINLTSKGTSTGVAAIAGLPFYANTGAASVGFQTSIAPSGSQAMLTIDGTTLIIRYASTTSTAQSTNSDFSNSSSIIFAGTYAA